MRKTIFTEGFPAKQTDNPLKFKIFHFDPLRFDSVFKMVILSIFLTNLAVKREENQKKRHYFVDTLWSDKSRR